MCFYFFLSMASFALRVEVILKTTTLTDGPVIYTLSAPNITI
jgi:hypothetical protein